MSASQSAGNAAPAPGPPTVNSGLSHQATGVDQRPERRGPDIPSPRGARMAYTLPDDVDRRPVTIDGAGTLGRRIAAVYAAGGRDVRIFDTAPEQREAAKTYVEQNIDEMRQALGIGADRTGAVQTTDDLQRAVQGAWMVIEAVPERVDLKIEVFGDLDRMAEPDAILATNSSSLPSRHIIDKV